MRAGTLQHRITIQKRVTGEDEAGQPIDTWQTFAERSADVLPVKGREYVAATLAASLTTVRFLLRYLPGVDPSMRVLFRGDVYDIKAVLNEGTHDRMLTLVAEMGADEA